jgi:hypothetical protein
MFYGSLVDGSVEKQNEIRFKLIGVFSTCESKNHLSYDSEVVFQLRSRFPRLCFNGADGQNQGIDLADYLRGLV